MFGLDDWMAGLSDGGSFAVVLVVATLLGLRHATDPDHIAAMTSLVASGRERTSRAAARLGWWWGLGHAVTLVAFGVPILLAERFLPEHVQQGAETAVAALIVFLAVRLIVRWRHGYFDLHAHPDADREHRHAVRSPVGAFGIGLVHGMGGSAGVGVLLLASIPDEAVAVAALLLLALFTAVSMTIVTTGLGATLTVPSVAHSFAAAAPALGVASLAFGLWYAAAAWSLAPYPF
jgi:ABC-type nickel/cobalt efflux system permease component RcnA